MSSDSDESALDPGETLRLIRDQQERAREGTSPDGRALFLAWGVAWIVGYSCMYASTRTQGEPAAWAFGVFFGALLAAVVFTIVHTASRTAGLRGASARAGAMYGWSWVLGFVAYGFILGGLARAGAPDEVMALASNAFASVIVGLLYLGLAVWCQETRLYALGVWILLVAAVATVVGIPGTYLVMAAAGGGGFLVMAGVEQVLQGRRRRGVTGVSPGVGR